jgi:hypothetical protein
MYVLGRATAFALALFPLTVFLATWVVVGWSIVGLALGGAFLEVNRAARRAAKGI